jgi:hypothetical protein
VDLGEERRRLVCATLDFGMAELPAQYGCFWHKQTLAAMLWDVRFSGVKRRFGEGLPTSASDPKRSNCWFLLHHVSNRPTRGPDRHQ